MEHAATEQLISEIWRHQQILDHSGAEPDTSGVRVVHE
jgi:hypothetical protein